MNYQDLAREPRARPPLRTVRTFTEEDAERCPETKQELRNIYNGDRYAERTYRRSNVSTEEERRDEDSGFRAEYSSDDGKSGGREPSPERTPRRRRASVPKRESRYRTVLIAGLVILIGVLCASSSSSNAYGEEESQEVRLARAKKIASLHEFMKNIRLKFFEDPDPWSDIFYGMYNVILHPKKPFVVTLFSDDANTMNCLAKDLGEISGKILGTDGYLVLTADNFVEDAGEVIETLKPKILRKRATIVQDLLKVNAEAIKAFHNFCDRECPLVENTIYVITVVVEGYDPTKKKPIEFIEEEIGKVYSSYIEPDILSPLVTRILDGAIIHVEPNPGIGECVLYPD